MFDMFSKTGYTCLCCKKTCSSCQKDWEMYFHTAKYLWEEYTKLDPYFVYESLHTHRRWCFGITDDLECLIKQKKPSKLLWKIIKKVDPSCLFVQGVV